VDYKRESFEIPVEVGGGCFLAERLKEKVD
jgi:hypothetical protein